MLNSESVFEEQLKERANNENKREDEVPELEDDGRGRTRETAGAGLWRVDEGKGGRCPGNTQGVAKLVVGRKVEEVIALLKGIQCRNGTSCPDQLARALEA